MFSSTTRTASQVLGTVLTRIHLYQWNAFDATIACTAVLILLRWLRSSHRRFHTTQLLGPPSEGFLYGVGKRVFEAEDSGAIYEAWAQEYGPVYAVPSTLGSQQIVLCDPKALAHFFANDTWTYIKNPFTRRFAALFFGKGLVWSHGEDHRRQRKSLTPAFSIAAIRQLTPIFYDSAYKAKGAWDALIESGDEDSAIIDVENWMNHISLDTIGLAGFSHNFGTLEGKQADVTKVFDEFSTSKTALDNVVMLFGLVFPSLAWLPTSRTRLVQKFNVTVGEISDVLLSRTQKELEMGVLQGKAERSVIGLLIKGASADSEHHLTKEEVMAQMKVLLLAGYETTSISLTWALLELARHPDVQTKLRDELLEHRADPTYDQLTNSLSYLDAVIHEILRVHPPVPDLARVATKDDVVPLSKPISTTSGELVDRLTIAKGTHITVSIECMNRSTTFWGEDAKLFRPSRWLEESAAHDQSGTGATPTRAKEIQGYRHLLTFSDGPKTCLGRTFAVAEFKAVLTVLVRNFVFDMRDGPGVASKIEIGRCVLPRPTLAGEEGCKLPLRVRRFVT